MMLVSSHPSTITLNKSILIVTQDTFTRTFPISGNLTFLYDAPAALTSTTGCNSYAENNGTRHISQNSDLWHVIYSQFRPAPDFQR